LSASESNLFWEEIMLDPIRFRISPEDIPAASRVPFRPIFPRREERPAIALSLLVFGFNATGRLFHERASTRNISRNGCCIHLCTQPQGDSPLALRVVLNAGTALEHAPPPLTYQFVWTLPSGDGWDVGAAALDDADLMRLAFPQRRP
jgi:hypothetical protein